MFDKKFKDKYARKEVCDYEIYDNKDKLITTINTVQKDDFNILRKRCFLKLVDALIDKKFYDYICKDMQFEGYIKAKTIYRDVIKGDDYDVSIYLPKVKLISYRLKNAFGEISTVNLVFEAFRTEEADGKVAITTLKDLIR